jgi:argininosuccinate synthase
LLAKKQVEVALATGCDAVSHGCTGKGNDQVRFELTYKALAPQLQVIAPWREWTIVSREDAIEYARQHNVPISQTTTKIYSRDRNIWHISHEGGALEDPANAAPDDMWMLTASPAAAPDKPGEVSIAFEKGIPVAVNGKKMKAFELLEALNRIGAEHAIGRIDLVENRFVGMKSRGCYETPGGSLIMFAIRELEALTLDKNTLHYKQQRALEYAEMVYNGLWFTPLREALDAFFEKVSEPTTGEIRLRLYKGNLEPLSRKSPNSLYSLDIASFTMGASYDQKDALGFINLVGLPIKVRAALAGKKQ